MYGHQEPFHGLKRPCRVPIWGTHKTPEQRKDIDTGTKGTGGGRGSIGRGGGTITEKGTEPPLQTEDGGVALRCTLHGKRNEAWAPGMEV